MNRFMKKVVGLGAAVTLGGVLITASLSSANTITEVDGVTSPKGGGGILVYAAVDVNCQTNNNTGSFFVDIEQSQRTKAGPKIIVEGESNFVSVTCDGFEHDYVATVFADGVAFKNGSALCFVSFAGEGPILTSSGTCKISSTTPVT